MAVAGFWWWRPTGRAAIVLFGPIVLVSMTAVLIYGNQRFRIIAEPTLLIGAAWFLVDWWDRRLAGQMTGPDPTRRREANARANASWATSRALSLSPTIR